MTGTTTTILWPLYTVNHKKRDILFLTITFWLMLNDFYSASQCESQCSHCKRCTSYSNSVSLSVRLSVTRRYCVKTTARSMVQFAPLDSKICLVL